MSFKERVLKLKEREMKIIEQAYKRTPQKYHEFIILLDQSQRLSNKVFTVSQDLEIIGVFSKTGKREGVFLSQQVPYMSVDGRVAMAVDETIEKDVPYKVGIPMFHQEGNQTVLMVEVITARGNTYGAAKVGFNGGGVDSTNPIENAQTSAVGRALGLQGYGLIGTGIASAEEVTQALKEQEETGTGEANANKTGSTNNEGDDNNELKPIGSFRYIVKGTQLITKGEKQFWAIAALKDGTQKVSTLYADQNIDLNKLGIQNDVPVVISVSQKGTALIATKINVAPSNNSETPQSKDSKSETGNSNNMANPEVESKPCSKKGNGNASTSKEPVPDGQKPDTKPAAKPLGTHRFELKDAKIIKKGGKDFWQLVVSRVGKSEVTDIFCSSDLANNLSRVGEGELIDIAISQQGAALIATSIAKVAS